jgi:hypothetical protein
VTEICGPEFDNHALIQKTDAYIENRRVEDTSFQYVQLLLERSREQNVFSWDSLNEVPSTFQAVRVALKISTKPAGH